MNTVLKSFTLNLFLFFFSFSIYGQNYTLEDYRRDSSYLRQLELKHWELYNSFKSDSLYFLHEEGLPIIERAIKFRKDTALMVLYKFGNVNHGVFTALYTGDIERGLTMAEKAYESARNDPMVNWHFGLATTLNSMTNVYEKLGDYEKVLSCYWRSLETKNEIYHETHPMLANQYMNLSVVYQLMGDYQRAEYYLRKSINTVKMSVPGIAEYRNGKLGEIFYLQNRKEEGLNLLFKGLKSLNIRVPEKGFHSAYFLKTIAEIYFMEESYDTAKVYFHKAIEVLNSEPDLIVSSWGAPLQKAVFLTDLYYKLGEISFQEGDNLTALKNLNQSLDIERKYRGEESISIPKIKLLQALIYSHDQKHEKAKEIWEKALQQLNRNSDKLDLLESPSIQNIFPTAQILEAFFIRAQILEAKAENDQNYTRHASAAYAIVESLIDKMTNYLGHSTANVMILKEKAQKYYEGGITFFLNQYQKTKENSDLENAFRLIEKSKSTTLLIALLSSKTRDFYEIPKDLLAKERETNLYLSYAEKDLLSEENRVEQSNKEKLIELSASVNKFKTRKDSILAVLLRKYPEYYRLKYQAEIPTLKTVQAFLKKNNKVIIEYFVGEKQLVTFFISSNEITFKLDPIENKDFKEDAYHFVNLLNKPDLEAPLQNFREFCRRGNEWYKKLHIDYIDTWNPKSILIIPDGVLSLLPFQVLSREEVDFSSINYSKIPYLFQKYITSIDYSVAINLSTEQNDKPGNSSYLGFAPVYRNGSKIRGLQKEDAEIWEGNFPKIARQGIDSLRFNIEEVQECAEILGGTPFINSEANEHQFKRYGPNAGILHLAMHAFVDDLNPLYSQFAFDLNGENASNEDGLLYAYELYNTQLNADLAILSACNTGAGRVHKGEGLISLSHAFKYAQCPNVVLNYWPANDKSAKDLVVSFARHLKSGKGKAEALNDARKEYLANAPESAQHPYFWAGLTLIGDDDPIEASGLKGWYMGVLVFILFLFIWTIYKWKSNLS